MSNVAPNIFPSSNDPTQEEFTQEVINLATIQAAIIAAKNSIALAIAALNNISQSSILSDATSFAGANIAAIKAKTDLIPADASTQLDTNVPAIKAKTDLIPSDITAALDTTLPAVKAKTDLIPADLSTQIDTILQEMKLQAPVTLSHATPTQNTYYDILAATNNVEAIYVAIKVATTGETLQVRLIIDGQTYTGSLACSAGTLYYVTLSAFSDAGVPTFTIQTTAATLGGSSYALGGRSVQISVEKTTNSGTGTLTGAVLYKSR